MTGRIRAILRRLRYPRRIILPGPREPLHFRVHNPVEEFRTAGYGGEREFLERFTADLIPEDVVFDIGASIGLMTVFAAAVATRGRVWAFEPDPKTVRRLTRNVRLNRLTNVEIVNWAVGEREGRTLLFTDGPGGNAPTLRQQEGRIGAPSGSVEVPVRSLDSAIRDKALPLPTVLKIDIEGAEILCLRGGEGLLGGRFGTRPRLLFLEVHPAFLPAFGATAAEVTGLVESLGYQVRWQGERGEQTHYCYTPSPGATT
jgi:FkbM family methyltransferase